MKTDPSSISFSIDSLSDTTALAAWLAKSIYSPFILYLQGDLGTGKTTFVRAYLAAKGVTDRIKSPTYTLIEPYEIGQDEVYHFDLYRLKDPAELQALGIEEYFHPGSVCFIEWPEKGQGYLPAPDLRCDMIRGHPEQARQFYMTASSEAGKKIIRMLLKKMETRLS